MQFVHQNQFNQLDNIKTFKDLIENKAEMFQE